MSTYKNFDDYEYEDYKYNRKKKMKTLKNDDQYGSIFEKQHKLKNVDPNMFDDDEEDDDDCYR